MSEKFLEDFSPLEYQLTENEDKRFVIRGVFSKADIPNKNGRVYPFAILKEMVESVQDLISRNGLVGELDHPACVGVSDFSILAKEGWKEFLDCKIGDEVATLDENNDIVYQPIQTIINEYWKGDIYSFNGKNISSDFTGSHRFYLENRYGKREIVTVGEIFENRNKYNKHKIIKLGNWSTETSEKITISGIEFNTKDLMSFMGIYLSEGFVSKEKNLISISQNDGTTADEIRELFSRLPFDMKEYHQKRRDNVLIRFNFSSKAFADFLRPLGNCYAKYIPLELKQLDAPYLEELVEWFVKGDGRDRRGMDGGNRINVFSVSKRLIEDLHELVIKCGGSGNWTEINTTEDYMFADHLIEAENKSTLYQLNLSTTKGIYLDERFLKIEKKDHDGNVYCITVPNGNFYMKQNGKSFWTGNSPKINVDKISHKITRLELMEDGAVVGEMEVLNTDQGRKLRQLMSEGIHLGVSTRALGNTKPYTGQLGKNLVEVTSGLRLKAIDVVFDPSAGDFGRPEFVMEGESFDYLNEKEVKISDIVKGLF